ncbi:peptide-binding protein [Ornithinibacillus sp. 4-3]|uniref:Peptide-binding protein n=1 Tax=Ornithinibacillus sp. 4-3 TaxID=3231488 RepID=A0AB39HR91_9BACI
MSKTKVLLVAILFLFSLLMVACSADPDAKLNKDEENNQPSDNNSGSTAVNSETKQGGDLVIASTSNPTMFNEFYASDSPSNTIAKFIYDSLIKIDENLQPIPSLAESWEYNEDEMKWVFHLREDVTWHDGEPFTAKDVEFTYNIPKHEDYTGPRTSFFAPAEKIEAVDDYTVEITFNEPDAKFLPIALAFNVLPEHILGDIPVADLGTADFNTKNPIGTGPFKFDEWKQGQHVRLVANDDYFDGRPNFDTITSKIVTDDNAMLAQFEAGDIDFIDVSDENFNVAQKLADEGKAELLVVPATNYNYIGYDLTNPLFEDKRVRQALTHALNREAIVENVLDGNAIVSDSPGLPFSWAYNEDVPKFEYDPEKAKALLEEAGWTDSDGDGVLDKDGQDFEFELKTNQGNKVREKLLVIAQEQWGEIGVKVTPKVVEFSALSAELNDKNFEAYILGWGLRDDPSLSPYFHSEEIESGFNRVSYSNPELDEVMEKGDSIMDPDERVQYIEESQAIVAEDQPYTFLYYPNRNLLYSKQIKNVLSHSGTAYFEIYKWYKED